MPNILNKENHNIEYSVIIPVFNSYESHKLLHKKLIKTFTILKYNWELILVDDFSTNNKTWHSLRELSTNNKNITSIRLTRNFGRASALLCGIKHSKGDHIVILDDDLQHNPEDILLLDKMKNHDVVAGKFINKNEKKLKKITSNIKSWFDWALLGKPKGIKLSSFLIINRQVADSLLRIKTTKPFFSALIYYVTRDIVNVNVNLYERKKGKSNYNFWSRLKQFSLLIINNSTIIPRVLSIVGLTVFLLTIVYSSYLIFESYQNKINIKGWTSLMIVNLFFGSLSLLGIGLLGEYLGRIFQNIEKKPSYIEKEIIS